MRSTLSWIGAVKIWASIVLLAGASTSTLSAPTGHTGAVTATQLRAQIEAAVAARDATRATESFQLLVARFPSTLNQLPYQELGALVSLLRGGANGQPRRAALEALFAEGWKLPYNIEPSAFWFELTLMRLEDHDLTGAHAAAARITTPALLVRLYSDQRFDSIVTRQSLKEEIRRNAKLEVTQYREAMKHEPRSLVAVLRLQHALLIEGNNLEAIALAQTVNAQINEAIQKRTAKVYDDEGDMAWVFDELAQALWNSGAFEEAAQVMEGARRLPEHGRPNVSQRLNLADMYVSLDLSKKALEVVAGIDADPHALSPYGMLVLQSVCLRAALQTGDHAALTRILNYLRAHETNYPSAVIEDFVEAGVTGEANALLRTALSDPKQRGALLVHLQLYLAGPQTPLAKRYQEQWQNWAKRPEVQREIAKWGHFDRYPVAQPE
jgi:tetratricopeptide (TPR) repeat protein